MAQFLIRKLTDNTFALPALVFIICIWRVFMPQLPANHGLGWDGYRYYLMTVGGLQSYVLDSYLVLRIFPCLWIHMLFKIFSISFTPGHVILAFKIMNSVLLVCSAWILKTIFDHYKLKAVSQITGFVLVFLNYGVLNFTYYYPVLTDTFAFFLSIALFYFFVKGEQLNIFLVGLIAAFTWPVIFAMAIACLLFPKHENDFAPVHKNLHLAFGILSSAIGLLIGWYLIFVRGETTDDLFTLPISYGMMPVTFLFIGILYFSMPLVLSNRIFFNIEYYRSQLDGNRIFAAIALFIVFSLLRASMNVSFPSEYLSLYTQIKGTMVYAFQRPLISVVSHFNYFGCVMLLLILFWRKTAAFISTFGLGIAGSVFFSLFLYFTMAESRRLIYLFPWLMIIVSLFLGQYQFKKIFYALIFSINFATAKLWLYFDYADRPLLPDGTIDFPMQWFFMHLGRWMNGYVWFWLCLALSVSLLLLFFSLYKMKFEKKAILFYPKFQTCAYE